MYKKVLNYIFNLLIIIISLSACNDATDSPYPELDFKQIQTVEGIGRASAVSFVIAENAYIGLGRKTKGRPAAKDIWELNSVSKTLIKKNDFPGIGRVNAIAEVVNTKAYVGLGFDLNYGVYRDEPQLTDFWCYNSATDTWTSKANFPSKYTNACVSFVVNSDIYVGFGFNGRGFKNEMWKYNTLNDSWTQLKNSALESRTGAVACSNGKQIFIGTGYNTTNVKDWWAYFPETDSWKKMQNFPDGGRQFGVSISTSNRFFVATGRHFGGDITDGFLYDDVLEYNETKDCWYRRGILPGGGRENAISFTINGIGYIGFGENEKGVLNDLWCFSVN